MKEGQLREWCRQAAEEEAAAKKFEAETAEKAAKVNSQTRAFMWLLPVSYVLSLVVTILARIDFIVWCAL